MVEYYIHIMIKGLNPATQTDRDKIGKRADFGHRYLDYFPLSFVLFKTVVSMEEKQPQTERLMAAPIPVQS
jgi:hypothetical protein